MWVTAAEAAPVELLVMIQPIRPSVPTNVYGATKRLAGNDRVGCRSTHRAGFLVVRFGNVLGQPGQRGAASSKRPDCHGRAESPSITRIMERYF